MSYRCSYFSLLAPAILAAALTGCSSPTFTFSPPPRVAVRPVARPAEPDPVPVTPEPDGAPVVNIAVHKAHDVPDLRGRLVALTRLAPDPLGGAFEHELTVLLVERGVSRVIPGNAMGEVAGSLDRLEAGSGKGAVKLSAKLSSLALVAQASGADYVLYGELRPSAVGEKTIETSFVVPREALDAYRVAYQAFIEKLDSQIRSTARTCSMASSEYESAMEGYRKDGGVVSAEPGSPAVALEARRQYAQFAVDCERVDHELREQRGAIPSPETIVAAAKKKKATSTTPSSGFVAFVKLREARTDETFWVGELRAEGVDGQAALGALAERLMDELSRTWDSPPAATERARSSTP